MKSKHYNVFVIGSGIAGQTVAKACIANKMTVGMADNREYGGTCANRGCDPKKVLLQFADIVDKSRNLEGLGFSKLPKIKWKSVQQFKSTFTDPVPEARENQLSELGIELYYESPKFVNTDQITVNGKLISADHFVIATGKIPRTLVVEGHEYIGNSDDILNLDKIPKSATFIGSGYIGMEFAYMLSTLGCKVTILEKTAQALSKFDQFLVEKLVVKLKKAGVDFIFEAELISVEKLKKNLRINYHVDNKLQSHKARVVYNTSGRVPAIEALELSKANVDADGTGVIVNGYLQSESNPKVYACGDVSNQSLPLTPLSGLQGYIVGKNIFSKNSKTFESPLVPSTVFTRPNLSSVGYSEAEAKKRYKNVKVYQGDASGWYNAEKSNEDTYAYKILVNERTGLILGAHLLSSEANEVINVLALAINNKMKVKEFQKMIFTYPSFSIDIKYMFSEKP